MGNVLRYPQQINLAQGDKGPKNIIDNYVAVLEQDECFKTMRFNILTGRPEITDGPDGLHMWTDTDTAETARYIEKEYFIHSTEKLKAALRIVWKRRQYHPVRDIIDGLTWDGIDRIPTMLSKWLKAEDTAYTREVSRLIFAGGIHRLYDPGCKFDDMATLIGTKQGEGKSTFVRWLAIEDRFFTEVTEMDGQRGIEALSGAWICEVSELLALTRTKEQEAVKSYLTRLSDDYRQPYAEFKESHPRQCIFVGTTNRAQFLSDKSGSRRFYPVVCNSNGYDLHEHETECRADILQCWAQAKYMYDRKEMQPCADRSLLADINAERDKATEDDYRVGMIQGYLDGKSIGDKVCVFQLWKEALQNEYDKPTKRDSNDIAQIIGNIDGWVKSNKTTRIGEYGPQKYWEKTAEREDLSVEDVLGAEVDGAEVDGVEADGDRP